MRKISKTTTLTLTRQTIRNLDAAQLTQVSGGVRPTFSSLCTVTCFVCPKG